LEPEKKRTKRATDTSDSPLVYGAVAVIVQDGRFLTIRRSLSVAAPGAVCFPGGGIEAGEESRDAVVRELREELALNVQPTCLLWTSVTSWNVHLSWWQCRAKNIDEMELNLAEVAEVFWKTPTDLGDHPDLLESNHEFLAAWRAGQFSMDGLALH
jgi:8-oxo-dGTP diphosphatase